MFENWMGNRDRGVVDANGANKPIDNTNVQKPADTNNDIPNDAKLVEDVFMQHAAAEVVDDPANKGIPQQQQQQPVDPKLLKQQHLEEMGITPLTLTDEDKEAIKNGTFDFTTLVDGMNSRVEAAYMGAMRNVSKIAKQIKDDAIADANKNTTATLEGQRLKSFLREGIPWIKDDPLIEPVAETMFGKFMVMTKNDEKKSRDLTGKCLNRMAEAVNKNNPEFTFNSGSFRGKPPSDHEGDQDWLNAFRQSQTGR